MSRRKKTAIVIIAILVVLGVASMILLGTANKIIKAQLEKALGENFKVARIGLSWGTVEAEGLQVLKNGKVEGSAKKLGIRADLLSMFRKTVALSLLVIEEPALALEIDESGRLGLPFPEKPVAESKTDVFPPKQPQLSVSIRKLVVKNGTFYLRDRRLQEPNRFEAKQVSLTLSNVSYPLSDQLSDIDLKAELTGRLVSGSISIAGTINVAEQSFNLSLDGERLAAIDLPVGGPQARAGKISFRAACQGLPANPIEVVDLTLEKPYMRLLVDRNGELVTPLRNIARAEARQGKKPPAPIKRTSPWAGVVLNKSRLTDGELLLVNAKIQTPPHTLRLTDISATLDRLGIPARNDWSSFNLTLSIPGKESTGLLRASGKTKMESLDTQSKISLQGLDLTMVKPYIQKAGEADLSKGTLSMDMDLRIDSKNLHAPTKAVLRNLEFAPSRGAAETFMALPRSAVVNFLKTNNEIRLDFVVEGSLDDPKFSLRESTAKKLAVQLGKRLGIGALGAGETIIDTTRKGLKGAGDALKGAGEGLQKLFR